MADRLAATSDSIADSIDDDDVCHAAGLADDLNAQVSAAIDAGKVPRRFQSQLRARATELVNTVNCRPPPAQTTTGQDADNGDENGNGKKKDKKKEKEQAESQTETQTEPTVTVEIPTTEEQP